MITAPLSQFIERVRVGSHHEYVRWNHETSECEYSDKPRRGYSHRVENDYTTIFHDCLSDKEWLKAHYQDEYPEPTIEIMVSPIDGIGQVATAKWNGDYKKGIVAGFMARYTTKARIGRRNVFLGVGENDRITP